MKYEMLISDQITQHLKLGINTRFFEFLDFSVYFLGYEALINYPRFSKPSIFGNYFVTPLRVRNMEVQLYIENLSVLSLRNT